MRALLFVFLTSCGLTLLLIGVRMDTLSAVCVLAEAGVVIIMGFGSWRNRRAGDQS